MNHTETIQEFYARVLHVDAADIPLNNAGSGHFNVFPRSTCYRQTPYSRRDFYKVSLILGTGKLYYADKWIDLDKPSLLFSNPVIPYSWEAISTEQKGWYCLFSESFVHPYGKKETLGDWPLFRMHDMPAFFLDKKQQKTIGEIFRKMREEMASDYPHKFDLLRNYLHLVIHEAMKMQPVETFEKNSNASSRITQQFLELLERQFPIDTSETTLQLKTANHFAESLSVHVNHLNRALKEVTGKTTTELIAARLVKEAMALLRHTDWNVAQIAYGLGFEYPAYFNNFFKKLTGLTPMEARGSLV
jgi:AraC family transcriptional regulator, transcriptional activator of pobA